MPPPNRSLRNMKYAFKAYSIHITYLSHIPKPFDRVQIEEWVQTIQQARTNNIPPESMPIRGTLKLIVTRMIMAFNRWLLQSNSSAVSLKLLLDDKGTLQDRILNTDRNLITDLRPWCIE